MTTQQAADYLQRSTRYVLDAARRGELVGYQNRAPHGSWRFRIEDVERWMGTV